MQLYYTPRSHFSRKVRLLLDGWGATVQQVDVGDVGDPTAFADNPLMKVPVLLDGETQVFDSDHIAAYLMRRLDPADRFGVATSEVERLNARAVMNGVMGAEVELLLAERSGIDTVEMPRFGKLRRAIEAGLSWLEAHAEVFQGEPSYLGFHLVALWDHLSLYDKLPQVRVPTLRAQIQELCTLEYVRISAPQ
ncbi:MAG: glutathione S-transferase family protein [Nannocystales bacterium]